MPIFNSVCPPGSSYLPKSHDLGIYCVNSSPCRIPVIIKPIMTIHQSTIRRDSNETYRSYQTLMKKLHLNVLSLTYQSFPREHELIHPYTQCARSCWRNPIGPNFDIPINRTVGQMITLCSHKVHGPVRWQDIGLSFKGLYIQIHIALKLI